MRNFLFAPLCAAASLIGISLATPLHAQAAATATPQSPAKPTATANATPQIPAAQIPVTQIPTAQTTAHVAHSQPATQAQAVTHPQPVRPAQTATLTQPAEPAQAAVHSQPAAPASPQAATSALPAAPDWRTLDRYQAQMSKGDFVAQLNTIFAPHGASARTILVGNLGANILTEANAPRKSYYLLTFAPQIDPRQTVRDSAGRVVALPAAGASDDSAPGKSARQADRYWKSAAEIRATASAAEMRAAASVAKQPHDPDEWAISCGSPAKPLAGLHVALDPGHIGGQWAYMEQREWSFGGGPVFREGDFVLRVAEILANDLRALGATVTLVRDSNEPVTDKRPEDFVELARQRFNARNGIEPSGAAIASESELQSGELAVYQTRALAAIARESELMFYRIAEIRARAEKINNEIQPDVVVCLHVDGTTFPPAGATALPQGGTLHVLVNGAYSAAELADDAQRLTMLKRMLSGASTEEIALADTVATQLAIDTGLPPMTYTGPNAVRVNDNPFVWGRNLIANRLYDAPTVFIEAYTANREPFYQRFALGEYDGTQIINGTPRKNIYREYADSVLTALLKHYAPVKRTP